MLNDTAQGDGGADRNPAVPEQRPSALKVRHSVAVKRALDRDSETVIRTVLDFPGPIFSIEQNNGTHTRLHDDHDGTMKGTITVSQAPDGDMHIWIENKGGWIEGLRFRNAFGGGRSLRVWQALRILAEAIRLDNLEHPNA